MDILGSYTYAVFVHEMNTKKQQQQWRTGSWSLEDKLYATEGRVEVTQALWRSSEDCEWIPDTEWLKFDFAFI